MGDVQVNETALRNVLGRMFPQVREGDERKLAGPLEGSPFDVQTFAPDVAYLTNGWYFFDTTAYELTVEMLTQPSAPGGLGPQLSPRCWVHFGTKGPGELGWNADVTAPKGAQGALVLLGPQRIKLPQGVKGVWFAPDLSNTWRVTVTKWPGVEAVASANGQYVNVPWPVTVTNASNPPLLVREYTGGYVRQQNFAVTGAAAASKLTTWTDTFGGNRRVVVSFAATSGLPHRVLVRRRNAADTTSTEEEALMAYAPAGRQVVDLPYVTVAAGESLDVYAVDAADAADVYTGSLRVYTVA